MKKLLAALFVTAVFHSCSFTPVSTACLGSNQRYYLDCKEAFELGQTCSGIYTIKPDDLPPLDVYCDMETDGGGWAVFQRRMDGTQDFYLDWDNYARGFGDLNGEFWLGLSKLHRLTASKLMATTKLRVDLVDFAHNKAYAKYTTFKIGASDSKYRLTLSGYMGNAGDSLTGHSGHSFSTKDQDNDAYNGHSCAQEYKGAWWYTNCHSSNLNGLYLSGNHSSFANGVNWKPWKGYHYSLKVSEMKVRRA